MIGSQIHQVYLLQIAKIIHLDIDYSSVSKIIEANIALFGEVKNSLRKIISLLKENLDQYDSDELIPWHNQIKDWKDLHGLNHDMYLDNSDNSMIFAAICCSACLPSN